MTLRTRFLIAAGLLLIALITGGLLLVQSVRSTELTAADNQLTAAIPLAEAVALHHPTASSSDASGLSSVYVALLADDGTRQVVLRPTIVTTAAPSAVPGTISSPGQQPTFVTIKSATRRLSWRAVGIRQSATEIVIIAVPFQTANDPARPAATVLLVARIALLIAVAIGAWWLIRLALRPIADVTRVSNAIASGDRSQRVHVGRVGTEATKLATAFNDMLDAQHEAEDRLRQFIADASHELRTPVAAIGGFADLYRHGAIEPSQLDDVMRRIGQEAGRMRGLVADMLLLARLDEGRPLNTSDVDLASLAADAALDASGTHPSRTVSVTGADRAVVVGDEEQLRQVLANLVANALTHTSGAVGIDVQVGVDDVWVIVSDDGPGLDDQAQRHVFDRFWRGDGARASSGTGLGLPIVQGIVIAHGGDVAIDSAPSTGTRVTITLPNGPPTDQQQTRN